MIIFAFCPVFGFGFVNPLILWGLAAASLPILLHLLNRRRYREEAWAAMRFLMQAVRKNQRRIRLEQWLLLLVRVALVSLLVMAMAQPFLESGGAARLLAGQRTHRIVVIDASMSMECTGAERSRFERAVDYADAYIRNSRRGDALSLLTLGQPPEVIVGSPSPNLGEVRDELEQLQPEHGVGDLRATLSAIGEVIASAEFDQREVLILTDLQANTWRVPDGDRSPVREAAEELRDGGVGVAVVDLGEDATPNHAVEDLSLDAPLVVADGSPTLITARLINHGLSVEDSVRVRLIVDGLLGSERVVSLPPGDPIRADFSYRFGEAGDHLVEVRLDEDRLPVDDARRLAVPVREHLEALLVDGDFDPEPFDSEADYLAQALSPSEGSDRTPSPIRVEVVTDSQLSRRDLSRFDVVMLCDVARLGASEVRELDRFVRGGGGLVVFGGDRLQADDYNAALFDDGDGLLPARFGEVVDYEGAEGAEQAGLIDQAPRFDPLDYGHPIVALYQGRPELVQAALTDVRTWRSHRLLLPEGSTARVALAFTDDDRPAVVTRPFGRGMVVQIATDAGSDGSTWPLHYSYPPVMEQVAFFAASGRLAQRNVRVGAPLDQALDAEGRDASATVEMPDGRTRSALIRDEGDAARFLFEGTTLAGAYSARIGPPVARELTFAANPDPSESDLDRADPDDLARLLPGWRLVRSDGDPAGRLDASGIGRRGALHRMLLFGVLALVLGEPALAWWIGRRR